MSSPASTEVVSTNAIEVVPLPSEPTTQQPSRITPAAIVAVALLILASVLGTGAFFVARAIDRARSTPILPVQKTSHVEVHAAPNVLLAMQDLARLETSSFHMERVLEITDTQAQLWGMVEARDALTLVAAGEVIAGIDLAKLRERDVSVQWEQRRIRLDLPAAEVFSTVIDNRRTRVHQRATDLLADRNEHLESRARQEAEVALRRGAIESGILARAQTNAERDVRALLRAMGFQEIQIITHEITER